MEWAKITMIVIVLLNLGIRLAQFGQERTVTTGWVHLFAIAIALTLYYFAGIMDVFK